MELPNDVLRAMAVIRWSLSIPVESDRDDVQGAAENEAHALLCAITDMSFAWSPPDTVDLIER